MIDTVQLAGIAACIGAVLGLGTLIRPDLAAGLLRLSPDPARQGGFAAFRGIGGFLLLGHSAVLLAIYMQAQAGMGSVIGTSFALAAGWIGAAIGRLFSLVIDQEAHGTRTGPNVLLAIVSLGLGLALMAPFLGHLGGR